MLDSEYWTDMANWGITAGFYMVAMVMFWKYPHYFMAHGGTLPQRIFVTIITPFVFYVVVEKMRNR